MVERERYQLVIGLGEGDEGKQNRSALDSAAADAKKPVTVWARELLLSAAGSGPSDPVATVFLNGNQQTQVNLAAIQAMQTGWTQKVRALIQGEFVDLTVEDPDELMARWKRVIRQHFG